MNTARAFRDCYNECTANKAAALEPYLRRRYCVPACMADRLQPDPTVRPRHPGEQHGILRLRQRDAGYDHWGFANYMGPGTNIAARTLANDPPRSLADKVAQAHDLRYALATEKKQVRQADKQMIKTLKQIQRDGTDSPLNTQTGMRLIQAKVRGERMGILGRDQFATFGSANWESPATRDAMQRKLDTLARQGF